jgi:hypothetical protein
VIAGAISQLAPILDSTISQFSMRRSLLSSSAPIFLTPRGRRNWDHTRTSNRIRKHVRNGGSQNDGHQGIALFDDRQTVGVQIRHIHVKDFARIECEKQLPKVMEDATLQHGSAVEPEV